MSVYIYSTQDEIIQSCLKNQASSYLKTAQLVVEKTDLMQDWSERSLGKTLNSAQKGDIIVAFDALNLARSHSQVLSFLEACLEKGIDVQFVKYNKTFKAQTVTNFLTLLNLFNDIEADFVSRRNQESIAKRQEYGIVLGRPKGRKNKALKLDKYKKDIMRYLELSISKASIAKLVDCHPQTLYDWIDRNQITDSKARRTRTKKPAELV